MNMRMPPRPSGLPKDTAHRCSVTALLLPCQDRGGGGGQMCSSMWARVQPCPVSICSPVGRDGPGVRCSLGGPCQCSPPQLLAMGTEPRHPSSQPACLPGPQAPLPCREPRHLSSQLPHVRQNLSVPGWGAYSRQSSSLLSVGGGGGAVVRGGAGGAVLGATVLMPTSTWKTQRPGTPTLLVRWMFSTLSVREPGML